MPVRDAKRRGAGWLAGCADIGWSNSLGWYEGFRLLAAVDPRGVITGFGFGSASIKDQPLAETFFALRSRPNPRIESVGAASSGPYVVDKGFEGEDNHQRWLDRYGVRVICPPKRNARQLWPKRLRRWVVERTFSWLGQNRRMSKDYERLCETSEAFILVVMIRLMVKRLAHA